ncbi:MAG: hypothetical protein COA70_00330 [Planctomycetota bacterium]|nr:MAG: hypothetical protein COA70_00330 [Planctomycetota bacterium]
MTNPLVMLLLLLVFSFALAAVLSCFREDEKSDIMRGTLRRAMVFSVSVIGFAAVAYFTSGFVLFPA